MTTSGTPTLQEPYFYHRLSNGLEMLGQQMPSLGSVVFGLQIDAGSANENDSELGLCQLLEDMMFQGTSTRTARQITDAFELLGARRIVGTGYETVRYGAQVVHTRLHDALALAADIILHPTFPAKEFDQLKPLLVQAIKRRDDEPMRRGGELLSETFFAGSRMARPTLGTLETVNTLTADHMRSFYAAHYHADKAIFTIAGNFDWNDVVQQVEAVLGEWSAGGIAPYRDIPQPKTSAAFEVDKGEQEHVYIAYPAITWGDPDYYAHLLGIEAFGGGMTSRLFSEVREKRGLVYNVGAQVNPSRSLGSVLIYGGAPPEKAREMVEVILNELALYEKDGITQDELDRAKIQLKSELVMGSESAGSRMNSIARSWWYEHRIITTQEVKDAIDAVTVEQIRNLNHRVPPTQTLTIVGIGPQTEESLTQGIFPPVR